MLERQEMGDTMITGGCLCGAVRYKVSQPPDEDIGYCHCRMCQKTHGGLFGCLVIFTGAEEANTFQFIRGAPKLFRSSARAERGFCAECGTQLLFRDSKAVAVTMGAVEACHPSDRDRLEPARERRQVDCPVARTHAQRA